MAEFGSQLTIEELGGDKRTLRLVGSGLPFRGASWPRQMNVVTTWFPGNAAEANQQVLGPQHLPSSWEGMWRRTLLSRTPAVLVDQGTETSVVFPMTLRELFEDFLTRGHKLRVTWSATDGTGADRGKIQREGRIKSFEPSVDRVDDIGWKCTFEWSGTGVPLQRVAVSREGDIIAALAKAKAAANLASLQQVLNANKFTLGQLEQLVKTPLTIVQSFAKEAQRIFRTLDQVGNIVRQARILPQQIANTILTTAHDAIGTANRFTDQLSRIPPEQMSATSSGSDVLRAATNFYRSTDTARDLLTAAHQLQQRAKSPSTHRDQQTPRTMLGVHITHQGDTMASIAKKWYGDCTLTEPICRSNHFPLSTITPPRSTVVIPALRATQ